MNIKLAFSSGTSISIIARMDILIIVKILLVIAQILLIGRFHFELAKINAFIEPVSSIRKITNPPVLPLKRWIPFPWAQRFAAITAAYLITLVGVVVSAGFTPGALTVLTLLFIPLAVLVSTWIALLKYSMIVLVLLSWVLLYAGASKAHPLLRRAHYLLEETFRPLLQPIQRILPDFGGIDFSPLAFFFGLMFAEQWIFFLLNPLIT